jgi:hypothetical protein
MLETYLGATTVDRPSTALTGWSAPEAMTTYRLYPGGKLYTVPTVSAYLAGGSRTPDVLTNPAGLLYSTGDLDIRDNQTITGTVFSNADILVTGKNVVLQPASLRPLLGTSEPVQLPAMVARDDIAFGADSRSVVQGVISAWDQFQVNRGNSGVTLDVQGRVVAESIDLLERSTWDYSNFIWDLYYNSFLTNLTSTLPILHFPTYLQTVGFNPTNKIVIQPPTAPSRPQWITNGGSIYAPHPSDPGLRWDLIDWKDGP